MVFLKEKYLLIQFYNLDISFRVRLMCEMLGTLMQTKLFQGL